MHVENSLSHPAPAREPGTEDANALTTEIKQIDPCYVTDDATGPKVAELDEPVVFHFSVILLIDNGLHENGERFAFVHSGTPLSRNYAVGS